MNEESVLIIKGRISDVTWLEREYGDIVKKIQVREVVQGQERTFWAYELRGDDARTQDAHARLNDAIDCGAKVWTEVIYAFDVAFALEQIVKLGKLVRESRKPELRNIYKDVRDNGEAAYKRHLRRLQELNCSL